MNTKQLITLVTLAFAGTAAMADDITIVADHFVAQKTRAEVRAEVLQARAMGELPAVQELDTTMPVAIDSGRTRDQVRAELRSLPKQRVMAYNPAA